MNKRNMIIAAAIGLLFLTYQAKLSAQVTGLSYTLSPSVEHTWWDDKAGLADGYLLGGKFGFGFGEYLELRASYMQSSDLMTDFSNFGFENYSEDVFNSQDVQLRRMGGELKANLSGGKLLPFLTAGTGVQNIQLQGLEETEEAPKHEQIYVSVGGGLKLSLADRYTLLLEAKNTQYRFNAGENLLSGDDKAALELIEGEFMQEKLANWSASASLQFYLGGRRPGTLSELDKAYFQTLGGGFNGLKGTLEPIVGKLNFNEALPYRDAWMAGGSAGIDFGSFLEIRGFYLQALEEEKLTSLDKLATYGGELRMKLNTSNGVVPYLIVGGGKIDVNEDEYIAKTMTMDGGIDSTLVAEDKGFAMGGAGLVFPISQNVKVFGSARALLTSSSNIEDIQQPDELNTSWMYSAGFRLSFGKKGSSPDAILSTQIDDALTAQQVVNDSNAEQLKQKYEARVVELERQLNEAYVEQDAQKAAILQREKETAEQVVEELNRRNPSNTRVDIVPSNSAIRLTPAEFENLIDEILDGMGASGNRISPAVQEQFSSSNRTEELLRQQDLDRRIADIEKLLLQLNERQAAQDKLMSEQIKNDLNEFSRRLGDELQRINSNLQDTRQELRRIQTQQIDNRSSDATPIEGSVDRVITDDKEIIIITEQVPVATPTEEIISTYIEETKPLASQDSLSDKNPLKNVKYQGMGAFAGFNLGGNTTANVGLRWYYSLGNTPIQFMPEAFFGFGSPANFGISGNLILPFSVGKTAAIRPYIGTGVGFMQIGDEGDDKLKGAFNIIVGTNLKVGGKGRLFVDVTGRNIFKHNQLAVGYRLPF